MVSISQPGRDRLRKIDHPHARNLGDEDLSAVHLLDAAHHKAHAVLQRDPETGHPRIGERDAAAASLLQENRDHASPASHDVAIAGTTESRSCAPA